MEPIAERAERAERVERAKLRSHRIILYPFIVTIPILISKLPHFSSISINLLPSSMLGGPSSFERPQGYFLGQL